MPQKKKKGDEKEMTINLDTLGVPIAIVVSAIILAVLVFVASRNQDSTNTASDSGDTQITENGQDTSSEAKVSLGDDPYLGDISTAKVAIVEFSDYMCGYCQRHSEQTFPTIKENYIDTGKIIYVFKEFPLSSPGAIGYTLAEGASCVFNLSNSEVYSQYHKRAFFLESKEDIVALAKELGIGETEFTACLDENRYKDEVYKDYEEGSAVGISGTPGFVVGLIKEDGTVDGKLIAGAYPYDTFKNAIEELLK